MDSYLPWITCQRIFRRACCYASNPRTNLCPVWVLDMYYTNHFVIVNNSLTTRFAEWILN